MKPALLIAMLVLATAAPARAGSLDYAVPDTEPVQCPSKTRFADEVAAKLGFSPWRDGGPIVRVRIASDGDRFTGTLTSVTDHERRFSADSCRKVADLLVTAVAITLDRPEPARHAAPVRSAALSPDDPVGATPLAQKTLHTWSFAPRNNLYQLGLGFHSIGGVEVTGNAPLGTGHIQATFAYESSDSTYASTSLWHAHAYYLYPVFYLNEDSAFEVPLFAGGGVGYQSYDAHANGGTNAMSDHALLPALAVGTAIQWNGFPIEFMTQLSVSLVQPPQSSRMGFEIAARYVFGRRDTRDVVRVRDL